MAHIFLYLLGLLLMGLACIYAPILVILFFAVPPIIAIVIGCMGDSGRGGGAQDDRFTHEGDNRDDS